MGVTNYINLGDTIIGEKLVPGARRAYAVDALGSVTGTLVGTVVENSYAYKPFGSTLDRAGMGADPSFGWIGTIGYRRSGRKNADYYIRARHYSDTAVRWTTRDAKWPSERAYSYANVNPVLVTDMTGENPPCGVDIHDYACRFAAVCITQPSRCSAVPTGCVAFGTCHKVCCLDLDRDGVGHLMQVNFYWMQCLVGTWEGRNEYGTAYAYANPYDYKYMLGRDGRKKECVGWWDSNMSRDPKHGAP